MLKREGDSYRHQGMRRRMVEGLRRKGISDERTLQAMMAVPRHAFIDKAFEEHAYEDKPFPIGNQQTISQPFTVAYQTALLQVQPRDKVLEVGTGSGYQAAVLAELGARVFTLERQEALFAKTRALLERLGYAGIRCFYRDGFQGLPEWAPFDRIIVTAGAPVVPEALKRQLALGGIMVIPVGESVQYMHAIRRTAEEAFEVQRYDAFRFVPFLEGLETRDGL